MQMMIDGFPASVQEPDDKNKQIDALWPLAFAQYDESARTKHVHRIHPYKGKFIPQLAEHFLGKNFTDGDVILDPFCGSGTTLVQCNELGIHALGIDISYFNAMISNNKLDCPNLLLIYDAFHALRIKLIDFVIQNNINRFEKALANALTAFNAVHFPNESKSERLWGDDYPEQGAMFRDEYIVLAKRFGMDVEIEDYAGEFMRQWYIPCVRVQLEYLRDEILKMDLNLHEPLMLTLSRVARSCRATTHFDLGTLKEPVTYPYFCKKHGKICKPIFSVFKWWDRYWQDNLQRWSDFKALRTETFQCCLTGDSRSVDMVTELKRTDARLYEIVQRDKIRGILTSPPYVGIINYHEQHAYAYDLFDFQRQDVREIGSLSMGRNKPAREQYVKDIAQVLSHCKHFMVQDYDVLIVANDRYDLYEQIATSSGMRIVQSHKRPVTNRTEYHGDEYLETIFHLKEST